jgi:hypothetical protein
MQEGCMMADDFDFEREVREPHRDREPNREVIRETNKPLNAAEGFVFFVLMSFVGFVFWFDLVADKLRAYGVVTTVAAAFAYLMFRAAMKATRK